MGEVNMCGVNHLDADAHLPPRKRLLAGLKKQNCDLCSCSSSLSSISGDSSNRIRDRLSYNSKGSHLSLEEIVDASRSAAIAAAKVAAAAKIAAEQKAAVAAKTAAAAKSALELVASFSEKEPLKVRCLRKNKAKKQVPVKLLYGRHNPVKNCETDEELARRLHRAMNSSPRISKNCTGSGCKTHNHKKHRKHLTSGKNTVSNGGAAWEGSRSSTCDRINEADDMDQRKNVGKIVEKSSECTKINCSELDVFLADEEAKASNLKGQALEDAIATGGKKGKNKKKRMSLSLHAIRDHGNSKEGSEPRGFPSVEEPKGKCAATNFPPFHMEPSIEDEVPVKVVSARKFKEFNAPQSCTGSRILYSLCSNPTVATGSAMVEVDQ